MKNKKKQQQPDIREINVDDLVTKLSDKHGADSPLVKRETGNHSAPQAAPKPKGTNTLASQSPNQIPLAPNSDMADAVPNQSESELPPHKMSRAKKQRLRLLKKIQAREGADKTGGVSEGSSLSDDEKSVPQPPTPRDSRPKQRRNYVERRSSVVSSVPVGSCGWKDVGCILFVVLLVGLAGFLKFQEEVFGSTSHLRTESDNDADFYEILGVPHSATTREIKRAYRAKAIDVHPDRHPDCKDCTEKFMAASKAYETLMDDEKRKIYDQTRGSYEPILSDYSVSLTSFNFAKLVTQSSSVWVIQVYDDLEPASSSFASSWDIVAGSSPLSQLVKFGRVNARRDRAVISSLPIRPRTFPTVVMFSRDTLPSIFSIADTSRHALEKWIVREIPSHINESTSNSYALKFIGRRSDPPLALKVASVNFKRVFDFDYAQGKKTSVLLVDQRTGEAVLSDGWTDDPSLLDKLSNIKLKLILPISRYNLLDLCESVEPPVLCFQDESDKRTLLEKQWELDGYIVQRVRNFNSKKNVLLDLPGAQLARPTHLDYIGDIKFEPIENVSIFIDAHFPISYPDLIMRHWLSITLVLGAAVVVASLTRIPPKTLLVSLSVISALVGVVSSPFFQSIFAEMNRLMR
jgi:curved DNA-binding protein CbpA